MMKQLFLVVLSLALLTACSNKKKQEKPIEINRMKVIMWDLVKAGEWFNNIIAKDSTAVRKKKDVRLFAQVFAVHGITSEEYYRSYHYYEAHPIQFKALVDSVDAYANREKTALFEKKDHGQGH